ncbi:amidohydrolase [Dactylosporangium sp. CA-233914]|uniref:amidohydrolase n=1 Tax=Dactylosporangium sp. CA-233914 TaxID=3239934 RepID=UPI003D8E7238
MAAVDLVIRGGTVVPVDAAWSVFDDHDIAIHSGRIVAIGSELEHEGDTELDATGCAVIPGLVNGHTHGCLLRGTREDEPLERWLELLCFPMEHALRAEHTRAAALMNQLEMIRGGTTTFLDMYRHPRTVVDVVDRSGLRAILAPQIMDIGSGIGESWEEAESFVRDFAAQRHSRITAWVGPHAPYTVEAEGYLRARRLADEVGGRVVTHLCETQVEVAGITEREGVGPVEWLAGLGVLDGLVAAHGVWLTPRDQEMLARHAASVVHNPSSNMKLASGIAPIEDLRANGVAVGLGTDSVLSNNRLDMLSELRTASLLQKLSRSDATALSAREALRLATMGSAEALGLADQIGSLEVGKRADIAVIDLRAPHLWPVLTGPGGNVVEQVVFAASAADVRHTVVDGVPLMVNGRVLTIELDEAQEAVRRAASDLLLHIDSVGTGRSANPPGALPGHAAGNTTGDSNRHSDSRPDPGRA